MVINNTIKLKCCNCRQILKIKLNLLQYSPAKSVLKCIYEFIGKFRVSGGQTIPLGKYYSLPPRASSIHYILAKCPLDVLFFMHRYLSRQSFE